MQFNKYEIIDPAPATGILYRVNNYLSGHLRMRARENGRYPYHYISMIDAVWGPESNTIEVCSNSVDNCMTVDINPEHHPTIVDDGQTLASIRDETFRRWRCDPPYNENTAREMYGTELPKTSKLLEAGARVCKPGALMFLLLGPKYYQYCPPSVRRIGWVAISVVPNNEFRGLHIYRKD